MDTGELTRSDWEEYASLKIKKYRHRNRLSITAPTWLMRAPERSLDNFLPFLVDPKMRNRARRDFANIPGGSQTPFFTDIRVIKNCAVLDRESPIMGDPQKLQAGLPIKLKSSFKPLPHAVYCIASDYSVKSDATGIACSHYDQASGQFVLDFSARIIAGPGERVDYKTIRDLIIGMRDAGFRIGWVGFDQFQSNDSAVMLEKEGFQVEIVKYADSSMGCSTVRDFILNGKMLYGECDSTFIGEAQELQLVNEKRVDHLQSGGVYNSKDVWDAVVNSIYLTLRVVQEEHGEFLTLADVKLYDRDLVTHVRELTPEEKLYAPSLLAKKQLPTTGHSLLAFIHCRFHLEKSSDVATVVVAAASTQDNTLRILEAHSIRGTPDSLSDLLVEISNRWEGKNFFRTRLDQPIEFWAGDLPFLPKLEEALYKKNKILAITPLAEDLSEEMRLKAAQAATREGLVEFPTDYGETVGLRSLISHLVAYPFTANAYLLLALEGAVRASLEVDFTKSSLRSKIVTSDMLSQRKDGW